MKRILPLLTMLVTVSVPLTAVQTTNLLTDSFDNLSNWTDLSLAIDWGDGTTPASAFTTDNGWAQFNEALDTSWVGYGNGKLNMFQALDLQFAAPIDHTRSIITIEFRIRWELAQSGGKDGESNRFIVSLNHDYPAGGIDVTQQQRARDGSFPWYARPAYQIRIRGGVESSQAEPILMYGGGLDLEGEYEYNTSLQYWFPGFVASVGWGHLDGLPDTPRIISPGLEYGTGSPNTSPGMYPWSTYDIIDGGIASSNWQRFLYIIYPDRQEVWRNPLDTDEPGDYVLEMAMALPAENLEPGAPLYRYFEQLEGVRLFWRQAGADDNAYLDWLTISETVFDSNYQFWASGYFGAATVSDDLQEPGIWGMEANPDGDPFPNSVDRCLNQSPLAHDPLMIEEADLTVGDYNLFADVTFLEYPDPLFEFYPLTPLDPNEPSLPGYWGKQANPDGDFYTNAAEQLLGTDPFSADPDPAKGVTIRFDREDLVLAAIYEIDSTMQDMTAGLQVSTDASTWFVPAGTEHYRAWRTDGTYAVVTKMPLPAGSGRFFVRFKVEEIP